MKGVLEKSFISVFTTESVIPHWIEYLTLVSDCSSVLAISEPGNINWSITLSTSKWIVAVNY